MTGIVELTESVLSKLWEERVLRLKVAYHSLCSKFQIYRFFDREGIKEDGEKITADELIGIFQMDFSTHVHTRAGFTAISNFPMSEGEFDILYTHYITWKKYDGIKDTWLRRRVWDALDTEVDAAKTRNRSPKTAGRPIRTAP